jgi:ABC-type phosphate transport system substrate-binding protein
MKQRTNKLIFFWVFGLKIILFSAFVSNGQNHEDITVITHVTNSVNNLKIKQLRSILKGEVTRWTDKKKIVLALMKSNTSTGTLIAEKVLNMSPNDMDQFYLAQVFQGNISAPKTFNTVEELKTFVSNTPGSIGVIGKLIADENLKILVLY